MPSKIHGVGVIAIRDIPKGKDPFIGSPYPKWVKFRLSELSSLDKSVFGMLEEYWTVEKDGTIEVPENGFNGMDISSFVNHSDSPNLFTTNRGTDFITARKIKKGEELTVSYDTIDKK